ncbi:BYPASS-related protein [Artemisia annua]|uniref:BYPASS-related protein n=1 Tax=Artemisia annua TaxID=35608 RepID=A0A2U1LP14_ARTAN|nr:BYPASS-related protein [Artemisia annua]
MWSDSANELQVIFDQIKVNDNKVLDVDDVAKQLVIMRDVIDDAEGRVRLVESVKDMEMKVKRFSDGVDALNSGVNRLYRTMLKTRNGCLDAKLGGEFRISVKERHCSRTFSPPSAHSSC